MSEIFAKTPWQAGAEDVQRTNVQNYERKEEKVTRDLDNATKVLGIADKRIRLETLREEMQLDIGQKRAAIDLAKAQTESAVISNQQTEELFTYKKIQEQAAADKAEIEAKNKQLEIDAEIRLKASQAYENENIKSSDEGIDKQTRIANRMATKEYAADIEKGRTQSIQAAEIIRAIEDPNVWTGKGAEIVTNVAGWLEFLNIPTFGFDLDSNQSASKTFQMMTLRLIESSPRGYTNEDREFAADTYGNRTDSQEAIKHNMHMIRSGVELDILRKEYIGLRATTEPDGIPFVKAAAQFDKYVGPNFAYTGVGSNNMPIMFDQFVKQAQQRGVTSLDSIMNGWNYNYSINSPKNRERREKLKLQTAKRGRNG